MTAKSVSLPPEQLIPMDKMFVFFAKFGDENADGTKITLRKCDQWFKQAEVINKKLTRTDTGLCYNKFKKREITYTEFIKYLEDLAKTKGFSFKEMKYKLETCGVPGEGIAQPAKQM